MLAVLMAGVCAARTALNAEKSARAERDRHIALQAAEAALTDAERDIGGGLDPASSRAAALASGSAAAFAPGCGRTSFDLGLCQAADGHAHPAWHAVDLAGDFAVPYGRFTGAAMPTGTGLLPARRPAYIIELLPPASGQPSGSVYRITAIGFGTRASTQVVLQSWYRLPRQRIGWREVANWPELHQAAIE
ncbi:hypothetical protein E4O92_14255 [Massilia horti]|uniref:PilX/PilW C-terminal domain-containing protein n=2 Tax=Massilia horti TaxID=2562153 RepID=A0A4Y9T0B7_9BURK|nr:hypothetical protein E4O92_14255 [Massilia horti]